MYNTFPFHPATIAKAFSEHGAFPLKNTDAASVLEFLHVAYADVQGRDPLEIEQGFVNLDNHLEGLSLDENNKIFNIVCGLCNAYEKRAFIDAIQIGAYLMMEVQAK